MAVNGVDSGGWSLYSPVCADPAQREIAIALDNRLVETDVGNEGLIENCQADSTNPDAVLAADRVCTLEIDVLSRCEDGKGSCSSRQACRCAQVGCMRWIWLDLAGSSQNSTPCTHVGSETSPTSTMEGRIGMTSPAVAT